MQIAPTGIQGSMQNDYSVAKYKADADQVNTEFASKLATATQNTSDDKDTVRLKSVCRDMEAVFLNLMWKTMRDTVPKNTLTGGGNAEDIMRSMQDTEMTKNLANAGGMGLADMMYRQLSLKTNNTIKNQASK